MLFLPDFDDSQIEEELLADISDDSPFPTLDWGDFESLCTGYQEEKDQTPKTIKMEQQDISNYESLPKQENSISSKEGPSVSLTKLERSCVISAQKRLGKRLSVAKSKAKQKEYITSLQVENNKLKIQNETLKIQLRAENNRLKIQNEILKIPQHKLSNTQFQIGPKMCFKCTKKCR